MFIKVITVKTKAKIYRYVRLYQYVRELYSERGREELVGTLGLLEQIIDSRASIIAGLNALELPQPAKAISARTKRSPRIGRHGHPSNDGRRRTKAGYRSVAHVRPRATSKL